MTKLAHQPRHDAPDPKSDTKPPNVVSIRADSDNDPLANFHVEDAAGVGTVTRAPAARRVVSKKIVSGIVAALVLSGAAAAAIVYARQLLNSAPAAKPVVSERARLNSRPEGASVI